MKNYDGEDFDYGDTEEYLIETWATCKFDEDTAEYKKM
jgi:hypothetical protein